MVYLDNAATTRMSTQVLETMLPYLENEYGNPDSKYYDIAENAKMAVTEARSNVACLLGVEPEEIIFTSGATEGNNTIIKGVARKLRSKGNHIVTSAVEHSSVYETMRYLESEGYDITYLNVNENCQISIEDLKAAINEQTVLVSIMWVNNETGAINPIREIAQVCVDRQVLFHTDATQAIGKIDTDLRKIAGISFLTMSGHKIYGPKGIGAMVIRKDRQGIPFQLPPLIHGGEQEYGMRAGTTNVASIVGLGAACQLVYEDHLMNTVKIEKLERKLKRILESRLGTLMSYNNDFTHRVHGILNIRVKGINNQILLKNVKNIFAASTGSACSNSKPSRVLTSMGLDLSVVMESIRLSVSPYLEEESLDELYQL